MKIFKKTRAEQFIDLFQHWSIYFDLPQFKVCIDTKTKCHAYVDDGNNVIAINPHYIKNWNEPMLYNGVFHEIGHIIQGLPYNTIREQVVCEREAERFAIQQIKLHYPKSIEYIKNRTIKKSMENKNFVKEDPIHFSALCQLEEYM